MKELKDYLHLYIGCKLQRGGTVTYALLSAAEYASFDAWSDLKPILRPLSDMTEEEKTEYKAKFNGMESTNILPEIRAGRLINFHLNSKSPFEVAFLLSKGFDLFGLIEAGLAIDKTKIVV